MNNNDSTPTKKAPPEPRPLWDALKAAAAQAQQIEKEITERLVEEPEEQASLLDWCGLPSELTRVSPFFPMAPAKVADRPCYTIGPGRELVISSAGWGQCVFHGMQLSIFDEDVLLALLTILRHKTPYSQPAVVKPPIPGHTDEPTIIHPEKGADLSAVPEGELSLTYSGPLLPLLRVLYGDRHCTKADYTRVCASLYALRFGCMLLTISRGKTKSGKQREPTRGKAIGFLTDFEEWTDAKKGRCIRATIDPFFYIAYARNRFTLLSLHTRRQLKGAISKALYRFTKGQHKSPAFTGHFTTLAQVLNLDIEQPKKQIRRQLKTAIAELTRAGVLTKKSRLDKADIVTLYRKTEPPAKP